MVRKPSPDRFGKDIHKRNIFKRRHSHKLKNQPHVIRKCCRQEFSNHKLITKDDIRQGINNADKSLDKPEVNNLPQTGRDDQLPQTSFRQHRQFNREICRNL
jgi:hypothetical protein